MHHWVVLHRMLLRLGLLVGRLLSDGHLCDAWAATIAIAKKKDGGLENENTEKWTPFFCVFYVFLVYLLDQHRILVVMAVLCDLGHAIHPDVTRAHKGVAI